MKFIHTADWHLGKIVQGVSMTDDQREVLAQLTACVEEERPDAVVIAGDLYDRAIPPTDAVKLLDELFERIVLDLNTPVLAIAGNHDSPERLDFATGILKGRGLHLSGRLNPEPEPVVLQDQFGEVHFHLIPYADPAIYREVSGDGEIRSHDEAMAAAVQAITRRLDGRARHVAVGHAFVTAGGEPEPNTSDSERALAVGGVEYVRAERFRPFHYTALGHLHLAHPVGGNTIRYAGSPLKYSASEASHAKGFLLVELDGEGQARIETRPFRPRRDLRRISGTMAEIERHEPCEDYVFVTLLDENPVLYPMEKIRAVYPNAMHVERQTYAAAPISSAGRADIRMSGDPAALFAAFYEQVRGKPPEAAKLAKFLETYKEVLQSEGEIE